MMVVSRVEGIRAREAGWIFERGRPGLRSAVQNAKGKMSNQKRKLGA